MQKQSIWQRIQHAAHTLADFQARILLTIIYVLFVLPVGLIVRLTEDALGLRVKADRTSYWQRWTGNSDTLPKARHQG
jgi:hypothetical protein